jgi:hypothetical protein
VCYQRITKSGNVAYLSSLQPKEGNSIDAKLEQTLTERVVSAKESGEGLEPTDCILTIFPDQPPLDCLHIIVWKLDAGE